MNAPGASTLVSVLITAHNAARTIAAPLRALARQSLPPGIELEVVVVDDRSSDETGRQARAAAPPRFTLVRIEAHGDPRRTARVAALDAGARVTSGALLLLLDADATPPPSWVGDMCGALASADLVSWPLAFRAAANTTQARVVAALQTADNALYLGVCDLLAVVGCAAGCCFGAAGVRREALDRLGGFGALPFTLTEDLALARAVHRIGGRLRVGHGTRVVVEGAPTLRDFVTRAVRAGTGGGPSVLAAVLAAGVATLPLLLLLAAFGVVGWPIVVARWGAGVAFVLLGLARARSLDAAWAALVLEPVAVLVAAAVWRRARANAGVVWGGVSYARVDALARRRESA